MVWQKAGLNYITFINKVSTFKYFPPSISNIYIINTKGNALINKTAIIESSVKIPVDDIRFVEVSRVN
jgi:hypothetical protein